MFIVLTFEFRRKKPVRLKLFEFPEQILIGGFYQM